jgi:hypothetical protein
MRSIDKKLHIEKVNRLLEERYLSEIYGLKGIPSLRTLTRKSKLGFGKYQDYTMQELIDLGQFKILISVYYKLSSINFIPDILEEIGIVGDWVIQKPGIDKEKYLKFMDETYGPLKPRTNTGLNKMKKPIKSLTKGQLQSINHKR